MAIILRDHKIHYKTLFLSRTCNIYLSHIFTRPPSALTHQKCRLQNMLQLTGSFSYWYSLKQLDHQRTTQINWIK